MSKRGIDRLQLQMLYPRGYANPQLREKRLDKSSTLPHSYRGNSLVKEKIHLPELLLESTERIIIRAGRESNHGLFGPQFGGLPVTPRLRYRGIVLMVYL